MDKFEFPSRQADATAATISQQTGTGLGTFGGVFTPSILTILGVIMYLRFGWVVGQVGLWPTLAIVTLATSITFLTSLSVCAIATDRVVRAGGAYYMISRSLGIESGGAIGIPLYFAQALSVALYTIGFAESINITFPQLGIRPVALVTTILIAAIAIKSAHLAIKTQYFIMLAIALSIISFAFGSPVTADPQNIEIAGNMAKLGFWSVFAVFFPAVTGIMAGVNMSGDLRDPVRSLPRGTLSAVGVGYIIYMTLPILLVSYADEASLLADSLIMKRIALWGPAILLGVWGATLSSAMGSILGAPRVMQALARDGVLPSWFRFLGAGSGKNDEPRIATIATLGFALTAVAIGDLNLIAPILTMFFLTTYLVLNLAAGIENFLKSPSFRPSFKVHWFFSLLGVIGCMGVMFLINSIATIISALIVSVIYIWLERRELKSAWGDVRQGIWMALVRTGIMQLRDTPDAKNWRPHILAFCGAPTKRWPMVELAATITHNRSLLTISTILPYGSRNSSQRADIELIIKEYLDKKGVQGFVRVIEAHEPFIGAKNFIESYGIGSLVPNTVIFGYSQSSERLESYCNMITNLHHAGRNIMIFRDNPEKGFGNRKHIDVWWGGLHGNGSLMLIMAYLLKTSIVWREAEINIKIVVPDETAAQSVRINIHTLVEQLRIGAKPFVILAQERSFPDILHESSKKADLVFLGMPLPKTDTDYTQCYNKLQEIAIEMPATVFFLAAPEFAFSEVLKKD